MQCPIVQQRDRSRGNVKLKTFNGLKNSFKKESNLDNIVDQLCTRLHDIKDKESALLTGMPTCSLEQTEAVRRYYAAFPALKKGQESPLQYYLPPPAWCRKNTSDTKVKMQSELSMSKDWNSKAKKFGPSKERRNSYHGQKKNNRKRYNSYNKSFESEENLPEWMTHEGVWDMETQNPVKEFIRAIALDEGYGTCENTVADEIKEFNQVKNQVKFRLQDNMVPNCGDGLDLDTDWVITGDMNMREVSPKDADLYAKFEAKFDRSLEALWSKGQNTPDDEYQDLPIDFQDLLSSPSDQLFANSTAEKYSLICINESIWSVDMSNPPPAERNTPRRIADGLHNRFRPLHIADAEPPCPREIESFSLYEGDDVYDTLSAVAKTMRSFTAINHSRERSGFVEVPPRRRRASPAPAASPAPVVAPPVPPSTEREDLLTSSRTHFRPIRREADTEPIRYDDGDTFDISGDLDPVDFQRSESGGMYHSETLERYLEYRFARTIDYGRLKLTAEQRCPDLDDPSFRLRFPVRQTDAAVQTERPAEAAWECDGCGGSAKKMRPSAVRSIWSDRAGCDCGAARTRSGPQPAHDELTRDWEELLRDISAHRLGLGDEDDDAETEAEGEPSDRKRRHSVAQRCAAAAPCAHPHARFLPCCTGLDRPLTR